MHPMQMKALPMLFLLAIVIAAPIVDAIACDDCKDVIPPREMQLRLMNRADHSGDKLSADAGRPAPQETGTAQDLCPVCANIAVAMGNAICGAPCLNGTADPLPKLIAFSDPSYPVTKPPQN
jgi:hypothetical protein